jgi:transposase
VYIFRGRSGNKIKVLWAPPEGLCCLYKRLNDGRFVWPQAQDGTVSLSAAQLSMLLEGIDWRRPARTGLSPQDPERKQPTRGSVCTDKRATYITETP